MDDFRTCSLHDAYHTGCIDCQHDMTEEISILKADNARMLEALLNLMNKVSDNYGSTKAYDDACKVLGIKNPYNDDEGGV